MNGADLRTIAARVCLYDDILFLDADGKMREIYSAYRTREGGCAKCVFVESGAVRGLFDLIVGEPPKNLKEIVDNYSDRNIKQDKK